jgi:hypothetical protein
MSRLVLHFLQAPQDQVDPRIIVDAKAWSTPLPTPDQYARTQKLTEKYPMSRAAQRVFKTIGQEVEEANLVAFDNTAGRPFDK